MSETTTAPSPAAPTPAPASSVTAAKLKTDEIVLGPGGPGGMGSFFAAFAAGAGGGGIGGNKNPATGKDSEEEVSLRPQTGFMKKPFASGSDAGQGEKQSPASGGAGGGKNAKGGAAAGGTGGAKDQKKKYVYTASYLRKFQSAGAHPPEDMAWYLNEVKPLAQDQSALPIGQFQQRKTQGGQSRGQERGQRGNAQAPQAPVQSQPQEETLPHRQSANPWLPRFQSIFSSSDPQQQYRQKAVSAVIGVLNKLTLEHFDSLSTFLVKQLKEANGSDLKEEIIQLVFDKAISEPNFSTMYASLCQKLNEYCPKWKKGDQEETFRNVLLSLCQKQFEKSIQRDSNEDDEEQKREEREWKEKRRQEKNAGDDDATIDEDWEELRIAKIKKRNLGNVRFVGELYKKKLLNMQIIHDCISLILRKPQPYDEDIEILCNLLNTVGKAIDNTKSEALVNKYFEKMTKLAQNKQYPARIRFMLLDTIELRANKWVPRKEQNAPQKIADIHAKAYEEDLMSAALGQAFYAQQQAGLSAPAPASSSSRTTTQPNTRAGSSSTATTQKKASKEKETKHVSVKAPPKSGNVSGGSSDSILETELNAIIEEYVNSAEIEEALLCLKQLPNPNWPSWFVFCATNFYVEKKERDRQAIVGLFEAVLKENLLPSDELSKGFGKVFVTLEDLEIDVPHAVERVGELVARCARGKWLPSGAIQKELEPLPPKIKSKLQAAVEGSR